MNTKPKKQARPGYEKKREFGNTVLVNLPTRIRVRNPCHKKKSEDFLEQTKIFFLFSFRIVYEENLLFKKIAKNLIQWGGRKKLRSPLHSSKEDIRFMRVGDERRFVQSFLDDIYLPSAILNL